MTNTVITFYFAVFIWILCSISLNIMIFPVVRSGDYYLFETDSEEEEEDEEKKEAPKKTGLQVSSTMWF